MTLALLCQFTAQHVSDVESVIKLVNLYSNIKMMHGPIHLRNKE